MPTEHFNRLSEAEAERLALLSEECGEVVQIVGKILRHGYESHNPFDPQKRSNRSLLEKEIGDVCAAMEILDSAGDIREPEIGRHAIEKIASVKKYLHHQ